MNFMIFILIFILFIISFSPLILAQQPYTGLAITNCAKTDNSTSVLGYTCNGLNRSCQSYLIFRSQPPHDSVASISDLLSSDPDQLSQINSVSVNEIFETNKMVIVPINCSCSGEYYQANTSYIIDNEDNYLTVGNNTFQGLSTCQALEDQNSKTKIIYSGTRITVPLRCACPTKNQTDESIKYLLSYIVSKDDMVARISSRFGVDTEMTLEANELSGVDKIYPFTTILVPLQNQPSSSQTLPPPPSPPPPSHHSLKPWVYVLIGVLAGCFVIAVIVIGFWACLCKSPKFQSLILYKFKALQSFTDNFSTSSQIKGSTYRGKIKNDLAAIKKMKGKLLKEAILLDKIRHSNLISLIGVCFRCRHTYLVYEFAHQGPLSDWIYYDKNDHARFLNWTQRIQIALDVATGLCFLHENTPSHIHKDIKSSNVLLSSEFRAKIAKFGLTKRQDGVSPKLDVYAFGILLMDILSGREGMACHISEIAVLQEEDGKEALKSIIDPTLEGNYPADLAILMVRLIDRCLKEDAACPNHMKDIVSTLSTILGNSLNWESLNNNSRDQGIGESSMTQLS